MRHQNLTFLRLICIESTTLYGNFEKVKLLLEITNHRTISSILFQRPILFQLELDNLKVIFGAALRIAASN